MPSWRVAAWSHPATPSGSGGFRVLDHSLPIISADLLDSAEPRGRGTITLPISYNWRALIAADPVTPTNNRSALIRVYPEGVDDTGDPDLEYLIERSQHRIGEDGKEVVQLTLKDWRQAALDAARVRWWDWEPGATQTLIPDHIYGGKDLIPSLRLADLGAIRAVWHLWLENERYTLEFTATGGDFTLTAAGDTTDAITFDPDTDISGTIRSELEAITGINEVHVQKLEDGSYVVVFNDPSDLGTDMTANFGGLTGGGGTLTKNADGFDQGADPTFTITVDADAGSDTTDAINWNDSAGEVSNHLELDLNNVEDVTVDGSGTYEDPWIVTFYSPTEVIDVDITFAAGTAVATEITEGVPDPSPVEVAQRFDNRIEPDLHGTYGDPPIEVVVDPVNTGSDWSLRINPDGASRFTGSQIRLSVKPGFIYQSSLPFYAEAETQFRLVVRDAAENPIAQVQQTIPADTWTTLNLSNILIPAGVTEVVLRGGLIDTDPATWGLDWYVDWYHATFTEGMAAATWGKIGVDLLADAQTDHAPDLVRIPWIVQGAWTELVDEAGNDWIRAESVTLRRGLWYGTQVYGEVGAGLGYEYDVAPNGADPEWTLQLWNPGGRGTDHTAGPSPSPFALYVGLGIAGGLIAGRIPRATRIMVEGANGLIGEAANTAQEDIFGVIEDFIGDPDLTDVDTINARATQQLTDDLENTIAIQVELDSTIRVFDEINIGDTVPVEAPGMVARHNRRISEIGLKAATKDGETNWIQTITASKLRTGHNAITEAIYRYLIGQGRMPEKGESAIIPKSSGPGRAPTLVLAAGNSTQESKDRADYILDGADAYNRNLLEAAIARVALRDGRLLFTEGVFSFGEEYSIVIPTGAPILFEGAGVSPNGNALTSLQWDDDTQIWLQVDGTIIFEKIELRETPGG